jgi:hypothetical protein
MQDLNLKLIAGIAIVLLFAMGALFMKNTHPYRSPEEPFESKQRRRRIGLFLIGSSIFVLGIAILIQILVSRN